MPRLRASGPLPIHCGKQGYPPAESDVCRGQLSHCLPYVQALQGQQRGFIIKTISYGLVLSSNISPGSITLALQRCSEGKEILQFSD